MTYMNKFDFLFGCLLGEQLLRHSDILSKALASDKMALSTVKTLESLRTDEVFLLFYEEAKKSLILMVPACLVKDDLRKKLTKDLCITTTHAKICTELNI